MDKFDAKLTKIAKEEVLGGRRPMRLMKLVAGAALLFAGTIYSKGAVSKPTYIILDPGTTVGGINSSGFVAGTGYGEGAFIRAPDGTLTTFGIPGLWLMTGINSGNVVIGLYQDNNAIAGFTRALDGTVTTFNAPDGGLGTYPLSINSVGIIAGITLTATIKFTVSHAAPMGRSLNLTCQIIPAHFRWASMTMEQSLEAVWTLTTHTMASYDHQPGP